MSRFTELTPAGKAYLLKMYCLETEGKLEFRDQVQLYQDLLDSGLAFQMGKEVIAYINRLLKVELITRKEPVKPYASQN